MPVSDLVGTWRMQTSDNFDNYMAAVGVSFMIRKMASIAKPDVIIAENDGQWTITTKATFKTTEIQFKLGESFKEVRGDGKELETTVTEDGGKLVQTQKGAGKNGEDSVITRWVGEDGTMTTTLVAGDVTCTRGYTKVTE